MIEPNLLTSEQLRFYSGGFSFDSDRDCIVARDLLGHIAALESQLNTPELINFSRAVVSEAQHQRHRWGSDHDAGKEPQDWFWLLGYLAGKALAAHSKGDAEKALHHTISSAAALANWHASILGQTNMRPGIDPVERGIEGGAAI